MFYLQRNHGLSFIATFQVIQQRLSSVLAAEFGLNAILVTFLAILYDDENDDGDNNIINAAIYHHHHHQLIYQPVQVTKKSNTKQFENILAKRPTPGLKNRLRVASKI